MFVSIFLIDYRHSSVVKPSDLWTADHEFESSWNFLHIVWTKFLKRLFLFKIVICSPIWHLNLIHDFFFHNRVIELIWGTISSVVSHLKLIRSNKYKIMYICRDSATHIWKRLIIDYFCVNGKVYFIWLLSFL